MAVVGESSSALPKPPEDKPVIVRVKRKALHSPLDAFWLEINERPQKRPLLDFENLSISDSPGKAEELKTKKVFVRRVETVSSFDTTVDVVKSFVDPNSEDACDHKTKSEERKHTLKKENQKLDQILSKSRQTREVVAKNARFEQIWRSRKGNKETSNEKLHEMCHFYDVVRVDVEERSNELQQKDEISLEDQRMLNSYLPLLREFIPSAALEIESDLCANSSEQASEDEYVYDLYAVKEDMDIAHEDSSNPFPLVQVGEEEFYDGPDESEYDTEDSNAENNPLHDYPDEEEEESESEPSDDDSEEDKSSSDKSLEPRDLEDDGILEDDMFDHNDDGDDFDLDVDQSDDDEERRWSYR